jgi:drug/metabolite transporter (DMT)-like permease
MVISSSFLFIITGATGTAVNITSIPAISWWAIAYLVIIGSVLSFIAFIYMIQNFRRKLVFYAYINYNSRIVRRHYLWEVLTVTIAIGGAITLFGLFMVNKSIRKARRMLLESNSK